MPSAVLIARSRVGVVSRLGGDINELESARRDLAAAKLEQYIARVVDAAPPLTKEQQDRISALLRPSGGASEWTR